MNIIDPMIQEFEREAKNTRKVLERIPEDKYGWRPHDRSFTFTELASHLANVPSWVKGIMEQDEFVLNMGDFEPFIAKTTKELLDHFDEHLAVAIGCMKGAPDEKMTATWAMIMDGQKIIEAPRFTVLRGFIFNHSYHHRGQLTVYLRMNNVPLPAIYGPSADEQ